jgi:hypothetical protein
MKDAMKEAREKLLSEAKEQRVSSLLHASLQ